MPQAPGVIASAGCGYLVVAVMDVSKPERGPGPKKHVFDVRMSDTSRWSARRRPAHRVVDGPSACRRAGGQPVGLASLGCTMTKPSPWSMSWKTSPEPPLSMDFRLCERWIDVWRWLDQPTTASVST